MANQEIRAHLDQLNLSTGKKARLYRLLYGTGPGNGTLMILPIDQGLEHGPRDFLEAPESQDPSFQFRIALDGHFSAIACQIGLAQKYYGDYAGQVPLILKLNGKTEIPSDDEPISPLIATVEDAVRLGADAVGYTLYVGSPRQNEDFEQFRQIREEADRYGLPVVVWSYPRGAAIEQKGGRDSVYAIDYAARVAQELGADVVKVNVPKIDAEKLSRAPKPYQREWTLESALQQIIRSAGRSLVIFAGGEKGSLESTLEKGRLCMDVGATGLIFGRNVWQQSYHDAMILSEKIHQLLANYPG
ncbi:MAG: fructose-bisphosphate aldolase [Firmicutes bacterium]|jgi:class I fructose-bisphosphate aldolase|uniref:Fructose-bisphosphate aldolase n=1 Tax=Sulfobacillus benefaciens TaxID=453960 RepID=A0A2T2X816_9FIRM|nr:fructose-bisphosphate aldolase [Bacillota bacterium]MCL5012519.1 fructose-bisphosphate aldolase [Bacillota bacterium]PSR30651.1 MAG: fructose-bisphosphate aldolase [Sulfobacillus benefaciens]